MHLFTFSNNASSIAWITCCRPTGSHCLVRSEINPPPRLGNPPFCRRLVLATSAQFGAGSKILETRKIVSEMVTTRQGFTGKKHISARRATVNLTLSIFKPRFGFGDSGAGVAKSIHKSWQAEKCRCICWRVQLLLWLYGETNRKITILIGTPGQSGPLPRASGLHGIA